MRNELRVKQDRRKNPYLEQKYVTKFAQKNSKKKIF